MHSRSTNCRRKTGEACNTIQETPGDATVTEKRGKAAGKVRRRLDKGYLARRLLPNNPPALSEICLHVVVAQIKQY